MSFRNVSATEAAWPAVASRLPVALGLNLVVAWISFRGKTVSTSGMLAGLVIGVAVFRERLTAANVAGLGLCFVSLWLVNRK